MSAVLGSIKQQEEDPEEAINSLLSSEPIPRDSRAFWDRVLADAGTPTRTQGVALGNGELVELPKDWLESNHSSRASFESGSDVVQEEKDPTSAMHEDTKSEEIHEAEARFENHCQTSSASFYSAKASRTSQETAEPFLSELGEPSPRRSRFVSLFQRKARQDEPETTFSHVQRSGLGNLDGPSDLHQHPSDSSGDGSSGDLSDGLYGSRRDRRTISANWEAFVNESAKARGTDLRPLDLEASDRPVFPAQQNPHGAVQFTRRQPSGIPRSPLHISQAAISSSPERRPTATPDQGAQVLGCSGLLSQPPRRRNMRYRPRSQSCSYVASDESYHAALPQFDGVAASSAGMESLPPSAASYVGQHPKPSLSTTSHNEDEDIDNTYVASSPPPLPVYPPIRAKTSSSCGPDASPASSTGEVVRITSYHSLRLSSSQSFINNHSLSPCRDLSSCVSQIVSRSPDDLSPSASACLKNSSRHPSQTQLPLPPPFSATRRNVSFNLALPLPSSPASVLPSTTPTDNSQASNKNLTPQTPPNTPVRNISGFGGPPQMTIYNDALPPATQPQTPADLYRYSRGRYAWQNPFNTAPPRMRRLYGRHGEAVASWNNFPRTPTRDEVGRLRGERNEVLENLGSVTPEERMWRRRRGMEMGLGMEERERLGL
ncbi:MAG: hypothetical protein Q9217_006544 [Psora testacea]